jgi:hypothetical protein
MKPKLKVGKVEAKVPDPDKVINSQFIEKEIKSVHKKFKAKW